MIILDGISESSRSICPNFKSYRLPQLRVAPENVNIQLKNTPSGTVATVSGNVASEKDKKLLQQLILLEPGIDRVENQLNIE